MNNSKNLQLFGFPAEKYRWFYLLLGLLIPLCWRTLYPGSIFRKPLESLFFPSATQSLLLFTALLVVFAILMPITGLYREANAGIILTELTLHPHCPDKIELIGNQS